MELWSWVRREILVLLVDVSVKFEFYCEYQVNNVTLVHILVVLGWGTYSVISSYSVIKLLELLI
eukprot:SAG31_NODE_2339_length_5920_cov_15.209414_2_plen_64_part_00